MESVQLSPKISYEESSFSHNGQDIASANSTGGGFEFELQESVDSVKREIGKYDNAEKFVCEYESCGKTFSQVSAFQKHERIHRGEKPYSCSTCGQSFTQVSNLKRHERLHTGEKPFACEHCDKAFSTVSNLKQHQQIHDSNEVRTKYECARCQKTYFYQSSLNKHIKGHEKKDAKKAFQKENKSLSPLQVRKTLSKENSDGWDDSVASDNHSDISPTIKKVKKERVAVFNQLSPNTAAETPNTSSVSSLSNQKLEEEFAAHYNKSLAKILDQTNHSTEDSALKAILNLQYLSISDLQQNFPANPGFKNLKNPANEEKALPNQPDINLKDFTKQEFEDPDVGYPVLKAENEPIEAFEENKPIYSFLGQDLFSQKPRLQSDEFIMKISTDGVNIFNQDFLDAEFEGLQHQGIDSNDLGGILHKNSDEPNDMIDYNIAQFHNGGWHENDHSDDEKWLLYGLKKEASDPSLMKGFLENTPFDFLQ